MPATLEQIKTASSGQEFVQEIAAFVEKHKELSNEPLEVIEETLGRSRHVDMDSLPSSVRKFIELQNRIAGRDVGRGGMDSFQDEERDGSLGPETEKQRLKRETKEAEAFRQLIWAMQYYKRLYELVSVKIDIARKSVRVAKEDLTTEIKKVQAGQKTINETISKSKNTELLVVRDIMRSYESDLKEDKKELDAYERDVLDPAEDMLSDMPPPNTEKLEEVSHDIENRMPTRAKNYFLNIGTKLLSKFNSFKRPRRVEDPEDFYPEPQWSIPTIHDDIVNDQDTDDGPDMGSGGSVTNSADNDDDEEDEEKPEPKS